MYKPNYMNELDEEHLLHKMNLVMQYKLYLNHENDNS